MIWWSEKKKGIDQLKDLNMDITATERLATVKRIRWIAKRDVEE